MFITVQDSVLYIYLVHNYALLIWRQLSVNLFALNSCNKHMQPNVKGNTQR
jgi:hypothetical protein